MLLILKHDFSNPESECPNLFDFEGESTSFNQDKDPTNVQLYSNAAELKYLRNEGDKFNFVVSYPLTSRSLKWTQASDPFLTSSVQGFEDFTSEVEMCVFLNFLTVKERALSWASESIIGRRSAVPTEFCFVFRENFQGLSLSSSGKSLVSAENGWVSLGHQSLEDSSQGFPGIPGVLEEGMEEIGYTTLVEFYVKRTISQNTIFGKNLPLCFD